MTELIIGLIIAYFVGGSLYIRYKLKSDPRYVKDYCKRWKKSCHISGEHDEKETVTKFNPPL